MKSFVAGNIEMLSFGHLASVGNIFHFITTRQGGVSLGNYAALNLGMYAGDNPENVLENRLRLCRALQIEPDRLLLPYQTHGAGIVRIDRAFEELAPEEKTACLQGKDALVTALPGYCIGVTTADCVPLLLCDPVRRVVAAIHAGWRGTVTRIVQKCIAEMQHSYRTRPGDLLAGIGPSICAAQFETGDEVADRFDTEGFPMNQIARRHPESGKYHIDLWEANRLELLAAGVTSEHIETAAICTRTHHDRFFSARRLGTASGRFVTGIQLLSPETSRQ